MYTLHRITPAGFTMVARGNDYAALVALADTATNGEEPNCRWQVRDGDDKIRHIAEKMAEVADSFAAIAKSVVQS